jgi:hypothetical protein
MAAKGKDGIGKMTEEEIDEMYEEPTDTPEHERIFKTHGRSGGTQLFIWIHYDRMKAFQLFDGFSDALVYDGKNMRECTVGNDSRHSDDILFERDQPIDLNNMLTNFEVRSRKYVPQSIREYVIEKIDQYSVMRGMQIKRSE